MEYEDITKRPHYSSHSARDTTELVTTGVNTDISGSIKSCQKISAVADFECTSEIPQEHLGHVKKSISFLPDLSSTSESDMHWRERRRANETNELVSDSSLSVQQKTVGSADTSISTVTTTTTHPGRRRARIPVSESETSHQNERFPIGNESRSEDNVKNQENVNKNVRSLPSELNDEEEDCKSSASNDTSRSSVILDTPKVDQIGGTDESELTFDPDKDLDEQINNEEMAVDVSLSTFQKDEQQEDKSRDNAFGFQADEINEEKDINEMGDFVHKESDNNNGMKVGNEIQSPAKVMSQPSQPKNDFDLILERKTNFDPATLFDTEREDT